MIPRKTRDGIPLEYEGKATVGSLVVDALGVHVVVTSVEPIEDYMRRKSQSQPAGLYRGGHVAERNALFAVTRKTSAQEHVA